MFKKKIKCRCGKRISSEFSFCPFCGTQLKEVKRQKEEHEQELRNIEKSFEEAFNIPFFVKFPFKKLIRQIDRQFQDMDKTIGKIKEKDFETDLRKLSRMPIRAEGISISVSSSPEGQPVIRVKKFGKPERMRFEKAGEELEEEEQEEKIKEKPVKLKRLTRTQKEKLAKLPREEPHTSVRRLTDKIIYEIEMPGVKNEKDIIINKLQNSIEIKAFTKDKAFFKLIPINLPIKNHRLEKGKLILELKPEA